MNAPSASLRSENSEMKSAVEMTPRGKRGKLQTQSEFSTLSTGLGNPAKTQRRRISTFPPRRPRLISIRKEKHEAQTKFQLTDPGHFKHYNCASVASLRP
jgi:hypothetical protein